MRISNVMDALLFPLKDQSSNAWPVQILTCALHANKLSIIIIPFLKLLEKTNIRFILKFLFRRNPREK